MKNLKTKIALMFGIACVATLLFAIPALACGNEHDYGNHRGFKTKSWFGVHAEAWQEKYVEPTPVVEEPAAQPVQEETPVQEQPSVEEHALVEQDVEMPAQEEPVVEKKEKLEEPTPGAEVKGKTASDSHEKCKKDKQKKQDTYSVVTPHYMHLFDDKTAQVNWKTKLTTQSESGSWWIIPTHIVINNITHPEETNSPHSIHLMFTKIKVEKDDQQNIDEYSSQKVGLRYYTKGYWHLTDKSVKKEEEKVIYVPWYQTGESINNKKEQGMFIHAWQPIFPGTEEHGVIHSAPATKENISKPQFKEWHGFKGANGITRPAQTTIIYKTHNSNTDMRTIHIRGLETFGPYAVNNNRKFSDEYGKLVPRQIQHIEPHRIVEDNIYKKDSTQPQKWIINGLKTREARIMGHWLKLSFEKPIEINFAPANVDAKTIKTTAHVIAQEIEELVSHLRIQFYRCGIANESTRKDIGFILLRHGVPVIYNNENIYHIEPSRIRHIYPSVIDEKHGVSHFVPVLDNTNTTKFEKQGLVKVRLYRPFTTSNFSSNTEVYLRPLGLTIGLIMQTADLANKPQLVKLAKSMRNNEEIQRRGKDYRIRDSLGYSYPAIFPTVNKELRGKIAGVSHTIINQNFKVKMSEIWPIAPVITNPIDGRHVAHPLHAIFGAHLIPEEERLGIYIPLPSDEKLKSATIKTHTYRLKEVQNNKFMKVISLAPEINGAGKTTIIKILTGKPMVNRPMRTATWTQLFLEKGQLETATQLKGGQHQRAAIARLLFPKFA